jgi:hypothetical protein
VRISHGVSANPHRRGVSATPRGFGARGSRGPQRRLLQQLLRQLQRPSCHGGLGQPAADPHCARVSTSCPQPPSARCHLTTAGAGSTPWTTLRSILQLLPLPCPSVRGEGVEALRSTAQARAGRPRRSSTLACTIG